MKKMGFLVILLAVLSGGVWYVQADEAAELMARIDGKQYSENSQTRMYMRIYPDGRDGEVREYRVESYGRGETDSYMVFLEPRSIRGLRILELEEDIRVFFPSTGRIRRITGDQKSGSAGGVGGDFSYEDIGSGSYSKDYRLSMEGDDGVHHIVRGIPLDPESNYLYLLFYIEKNSEQVKKVEYFTREEGHKKTLTLDNYTTVQSVEMPSSMEMVNHEDGGITIIEIAAARYNIDIDEKFFNPNRFYR